MYKQVSKNTSLSFTSKFTDFEIMNSEFTKCRCYMMASGDNVNGSNITLEAIDKAIERHEFDNKPVVAHLYRDPSDGSWRVGGHDSRWEVTNTDIELIDECVPFGTIPESGDIHKEEVLEPDGLTKNTYLVSDIILWTGRYNIMDAAYSDTVYFNQSCEISINDYHWQDNDILAIDDFTFSALCLLNKSDDPDKNVQPAFASCRVEKLADFSVNEESFKKNYELLLEDLKQFSINNKPLSNDMKGENTMELTKFVDVLSAEKIEGTDNLKYAVLNADDNRVFVLDMEDYKPYGMDYAVVTEDDTEKLVIDFDSKVEMSLSATEKIADESFEEFSIANEIDKVAEVKANAETETIKEQFNANLEGLKTDLEKMSADYKSAAAELDKYKAKEAADEIKAREDEINALFSKYAAKLGKCAEFLVYKAKVNPAETTVDEVQEKLTMMAGRYMLENGSAKKSFNYEPVDTKVNGSADDEKTTSRYGHLLDKWI